AGGATTTVYPTTGRDDAVYILRDSGSKVAIVEDPTQAAKIAGADLPDLTHVVLMTGAADANATPTQLTLSDLETRGREALAADPELVRRLAAAVEPDHLATLI